MTQAVAPGRPRPQPTARPALVRSWQRARRALAPDAATNPAVLVATRVLGLVALLALWLVLFGTVLSTLVYSHAQSDLYARFRTELAGGVAPLGGAVPEGDPVAMITAKAAGLHGVVVVEGSSSRDLQSGPGHKPGTPLPGQAGASLILGRASTFGAPFASIAELVAGDPITVTTGQGVFTYLVEDVRRPGDPLPKALAADGSQLTLVTGAGAGWRSGWAPSTPVYVDALLKGKTVAAPAQTGVSYTRDAVFARDTRGLYPLILWLQLLIVAAVGGVWVQSRWGVARAWLLAAPVGLAGLWGASVALWLLLPNLL